MHFGQTETFLGFFQNGFYRIAWLKSLHLFTIGECVYSGICTLEHMHLEVMLFLQPLRCFHNHDLLSRFHCGDFNIAWHSCCKINRISLAMLRVHFLSSHCKGPATTVKVCRVRHFQTKDMYIITEVRHLIYQLFSLDHDIFIQWKSILKA